MIKRNKIICKTLVIGIAFNILSSTNNINLVYASSKSEAKSILSEGNVTEIDGMVIKDGVLISGEDAKGNIEIPSSVSKIEKYAFFM